MRKSRTALAIEDTSIIRHTHTLRGRDAEFLNLDPLKTKRRLLYLKAQSVPRCKHFISVIKTNQFML